MRAFSLFLLIVTLAGCSQAPSHADEDAYDDAERAYQMGYENDLDFSAGAYSDGSDNEYYDQREPFDEDLARDYAEEELTAEGYDYSYGCTDDCSGHEAGWQWRAEHGYSTYGNSQSFAEGGYAFDDAVEDRVEDMRDNYDEGEEPNY